MLVIIFIECNSYMHAHACVKLLYLYSYLTLLLLTVTEIKCKMLFKERNPSLYCLNSSVKFISLLHVKTVDCYMWITVYYWSIGTVAAYGFCATIKRVHYSIDSMEEGGENGQILWWPLCITYGLDC